MVAARAKGAAKREEDMKKTKTTAAKPAKTTAKAKKAADPKAGKTGYAARITDKEVERAKKLAQRKSGVTRQQLADALKCGIDRAAKVLSRAGAVGTPGGTGKAYRTLVYTIA